MTACVNNEGLSGKKVVSATLAGVLAAGMVPAIAFADEAAEVTPDEDIDLLLVTNVQDFAAGTIGAAVDQNNKAVTLPAKGKSLKVTQDGANAVKVQVTQVVTKTGVVVDLDADNAKWDYFKDDARTQAATDFTTVGATVYARVTVSDSNNPYNTATFDYDYTIQASALDGAAIVDKDTKKSEFTYEAATGAAFANAVKVMLNGEEVNASVKIFDKKTSAEVTSGVMAAGDYVAEITATAGKYNGSKTQYAFTVAPLNLSTAEVLMQDLKSGEGIDDIAILKINGKDAAADLINQLDVTYKSGPDGTLIVDRDGKYTVTLTPKEEAGKSITGQADASFLKVNAVEEVKYKNGSFTDTSVKTTDKTTYIAASDFASDNVTSDDIIIKVVNADGKEVTLSEMNTTPGVYTLTAMIDSANLETPYQYGGSNSMKVTVTKADVAPADVAISYKGKMLAANETVDFTGQNLMSDIKVVVLDSKGNALTEGTDYVVKVTKAGKDVDEIINRGAYKIEVTSEAYSITSGNVVALTVDPMEISNVRVANTLTSRVTKNTTSDTFVEFLPFTDAAITPAIEYKTPDGDWVSVPADTFKLEYGYVDDPTEDLTSATTSVAKMLKKGLYKVTVKDAKADQDITFNNAVAGVCVLDEKAFADANPNDWYYNVIYKANQNKYMNGYLGSNLFGANDSITRADVVCVLYNMASSSMITDNQPNTPNATYESFADVDSSKYYAKAVAWAKKAGIVNGFGDGTFNPEGNVSRQDFACMLGNYAKVVGNFKTPADIDAVLAKFSDGNAVSDYAKESVAWAADQKIMGNGGMIMPQNTITRAEVAAMVVNYQPERI